MPAFRAFDWLFDSLRTPCPKSRPRRERRRQFVRSLRMERLDSRIALVAPPTGGPTDPWLGLPILPPGNPIGNPNDPVPTVNISVDHEQIYESGNPRLATVFRFTKPAGVGAIQVNYAIDGTATFGSDYNLSGNTLHSILIPANQTSATLTVTAINDTVVDPAETVKANLLPGPGYVVGAGRRATTTIVDDEPAPPTVSLYVNRDTINENSSPSTATYTITRNGTTGSLTVGYFLSGTATYNTDYSGPSLSIIDRKWQSSGLCHDFQWPVVRHVHGLGNQRRDLRCK